MSVVVRLAARNEHGVTARAPPWPAQRDRIERANGLHVELRIFFVARINDRCFSYFKGFLSKDSHMKKRDNRQKLSLSRETLRRLEAPLLEGVVGGTVLTCIPAKCTSDFNPTMGETKCC
jgi:hypothetical protein